MAHVLTGSCPIAAGGLGGEWWRRSLLIIAFAAGIGCGRPVAAGIESLRDGHLNSYRLNSVTGARDGDTLQAAVIFKADASMLKMGLLFRLGIPTRLEAGRYRWQQGDKIVEGSIRERSVTFLGGQSGRPSIGGTFELLSPDGEPLYKVTLPTTEVAARR